MPFTLLLNRIFDLLSFGVSPTARYLFIAVMSLISAVMFLLIFKRTSNQRKITLHKNKIFGYVLQIPLYQDRFGLLIRSVLQILKHNLCYIGQTLIPLVFILPPLLLLTVQINNRCGYAPLSPNQSFTLRATIADAAAPAAAQTLEALTCEVTPGLTLETPALRIPADGTAYWRLRVAADLPGFSADRQHCARACQDNRDRDARKTLCPGIAPMVALECALFQRRRLSAKQLAGARNFSCVSARAVWAAVLARRCHYPLFYPHAHPVLCPERPVSRHHLIRRPANFAR